MYDLSPFSSQGAMVLHHHHLAMDHARRDLPLLNQALPPHLIGQGQGHLAPDRLGRRCRWGSIT